MNKKHQWPPKRELIILFSCLGIWWLVTTLFIGIRPEHPLLILLIAGLFCAHPQTKKLVVALLPFILFAISYDWMNLCPNYKVNPIDVQDLYETEKNLFGITTAGGILTPNEYFMEHNHPFMDFWAGIFYLCWVPVPILFGLSLYFTKQRTVYLRFAIVFLFVNLIGFCGYYIHPAAPPWYVMKYGFEPILNTPGDVAGLGRFDEITGLGIFHFLYSRNSNVFAAVPSLHSAYMVIAFYYSFKAKYPNSIRAIFGIIMLGIWFTAIYSAHHYVIDAILGAGCAILGILLFEKLLLKWNRFANFINKYTAYIS